MTTVDPTLRLTCPSCGVSLAYIGTFPDHPFGPPNGGGRSDVETNVYRCSKHGLFPCSLTRTDETRLERRPEPHRFALEQRVVIDARNAPLDASLRGRPYQFVVVARSTPFEVERGIRVSTYSAEHS
jgi:hypothetical protein